MAGQGGVLPVMLSADELVLNVNKDLAYIPYSEYLRVKLGRVTEGQKRQPGVNAGQMTFIREAGRH